MRIRRAGGRSLLLLGLAAAFGAMPARPLQTAPASLETALEAITPRLLRSHVQFLSHDLLEGRNTGEAGYEIAREYVASQFVRIGLEPAFGDAYTQEVPLLVSTSDEGSTVRVGDLELRGEDVSVAPDWLGRSPVVAAPGVYVGYGLAARGRDDFAGADVRDKIVFVLPGVPEAWTEDPVGSLQSRLKIPQAIQRGARGVVVLQLTGEIGPRRAMALADGSTPSPRPLATIGGEGARRLLERWGIDPAAAGRRATESDPPRSVGDVTVSRRRPVVRAVSWNVGGVVRGSDAALRQETVVFTAHLDHVGTGEPDERGDRIFNGTHDNALGVAKLLASAEAMGGVQPRRSVVFVAVGAEERGLLGSWHYVHHPVGRARDIATNINHDGGLDSAPPEDVFAFGAEYSDMGDALESAARDTGMRVTRELRSPFSPSQALLFRSDHYSFLVRGIPAIYLMDGFTIAGDPDRGRDQWDHYLKNTNHQQRDNFDPGWSFEAPARMAALSVRLAWRIANATERPRMRPGGPFPTSVQSTSPSDGAPRRD